LTWFQKPSILFCKVIVKHAPFNLAKKMNDNPDANQNQSEDSEPTFEVDKNDFSKHWLYLKKRENLLLGTLVSIGAALVCLAIWLIVMRFTGYKIGWMALAAGFGIGFAMQFFGKGVSPQFGVIGGAISLVTWLLGNFFTAAIIFSRLKHVALLTLMSHIDFSMVTLFLKAVIGPIDFLLCASAVYAAYYIGFKRVVPDNIK